MFQGQLIAICLASAKCEPLRCVEQAEAVVAQGLVGDRYGRQQGSFSKSGSPDREVTLIETETIESLARDYQISIPAEQGRRNLVTQGVALNHLIGKEFMVGSVRLRGLRLCEPCGHLEKLTVPGIEKALKHRGGLRAQVVQGGTLRVGDVIVLAGPEVTAG